MSTYWEIFLEEFEFQTYSFLMMDNLGSYFNFQISPPWFHFSRNCPKERLETGSQKTQVETIARKIT